MIVDIIGAKRWYYMPLFFSQYALLLIAAAHLLTPCPALGAREVNNRPLDTYHFS